MCVQCDNAIAEVATMISQGTLVVDEDGFFHYEEDGVTDDSETHEEG